MKSICFVFFIGLFACAPKIIYQGNSNIMDRKIMSMIVPDVTTKAQVIKFLGKPEFINNYGTNKSSWSYSHKTTKHNATLFLRTMVEVVSLEFEGNVLINISQNTVGNVE